jgi:hypothetical protein
MQLNQSLPGCLPINIYQKQVLPMHEHTYNLGLYSDRCAI